jgi:hypothetical protein
MQNAYHVGRPLTAGRGSEEPENQPIPVLSRDREGAVSDITRNFERTPEQNAP